MGCHPTRCGEFDGDDGPDRYLDSLKELVTNNRQLVSAIGEFGLDYDRTKFCDVDTQKKYFLRQLELSRDTGLPVFLHCRAAGTDLVNILTNNMDKVPAGGVVHSFDGSAEDRDKILSLGLHIGINGCSLKTEENLAVMAGIPAERLMVETDCPWCEVRPSHAGHKLIKTRSDQWPAVDKKKWREGVTGKGRNEPHNIRQVLEIMAAVREVDPQELADQIYNNTINVFFGSR